MDTLDFPLAVLQLAFRCRGELQKSCEYKHLRKCMSAGMSCLVCSVGALSLPIRSQTISWICQSDGRRIRHRCFLPAVWLWQFPGFGFSLEKNLSGKKHCWFQQLIKCGEFLRKKKSEMRSSEGACRSSTLDEKGLKSKIMETHTDSHKNNTNNITTDRKTELKRNYFVHSIVDSIPKTQKNTPLRCLIPPSLWVMWHVFKSSFFPTAKSH